MSRYYSLNNVWIDRPSMQSSDVTTPWPLLGFMQKVTHNLQVANREISFGNVCMIQNCFIFSDHSSCLTFKLSTACSTTLNQLYLILDNQTLSQSSNEINTHTEHFVQKHDDLLSLKRSYLVLNEEKKTRRQEGKSNRIITLDDKNSKKVEL